MAAKRPSSNRAERRRAKFLKIKREVAHIPDWREAGPERPLEPMAFGLMRYLRHGR